MTLEVISFNIHLKCFFEMSILVITSYILLRAITITSDSHTFALVKYVKTTKYILALNIISDTNNSTPTVCFGVCKRKKNRMKLTKCVPILPIPKSDYSNWIARWWISTINYMNNNHGLFAVLVFVHISMENQQLAKVLIYYIVRCYRCLDQYNKYDLYFTFNISIQLPIFNSLNKL